MRAILLGFVLMTLTPVACAGGVMSGDELARYAAAYDRSNGRSPQLADQDYYDALKFAYYVQGALDSAIMAKALCPPRSGAKMSQMYAVISKYLRNHPEEWDVNASIAVLGALMHMMPCRK